MFVAVRQPLGAGTGGERLPGRRRFRLPPALVSLPEINQCLHRLPPDGEREKSRALFHGFVTRACPNSSKFMQVSLDPGAIWQGVTHDPFGENGLAAWYLRCFEVS